jgi:hypothetical protein
MHARIVLPALAAAALLAAGCAPIRSTQGLPDGSYTEGGRGSWFYAEVVKPNEGGKPRICLFTTVALFDLYVAKGEINELKHKKFIGAGKNGETLIVETGGMLEAKDLVARYKQRNGMPE